MINKKKIYSHILDSQPTLINLNYFQFQLNRAILYICTKCCNTQMVLKEITKKNTNEVKTKIICFSCFDI